VGLQVKRGLSAGRGDTVAVGRFRKKRGRCLERGGHVPAHRVDAVRTPGPRCFQNNISPQNMCVGQLDCGVGGTGTKAGNETLTAFFPDASPNFRRNILIGAPLGDYPTDNFFPPSRDDVGFVDWMHGDYHLASGSMFKGRGTDGKDPGCDIDALTVATAGVE
jgi:hypothetical protein